MDGQRRAAAWCGRLLLLGALLCGIVMMHTLGHPPMASAMENPAQHGSAQAPASAEAPAAHGSARLETRTASRAPHADGPMPTDGMNPLAVCLAVLGAGIISLTAAGLLRWQCGDLLTSARTGLRYALRPNPPPRGLSLVQLSVLRV